MSLLVLLAIIYLLVRYSTLVGFMVFVRTKNSALVEYGKTCHLVDCLFDACGRPFSPLWILFGLLGIFEESGCVE